MSRLRAEGGFTLIELLVSMIIVTVVMMATISAFASFSRNERVNRLQNESQDEARLTMERLSGQLRNLASPNDFSPKSVEKAEPYDIVFLTVDAVKPVGSTNARNIKRVRYCIGNVSGGKASLIKQQQTWQVVSPPPAFSTAGCPNASWGNSTEVAQDVVNTAQVPAVPVFTYSPGGAALDGITAIYADFMVDWNPVSRPRRPSSTPVFSSATRTAPRSRSAPRSTRAPARRSRSMGRPPRTRRAST